MTEREWEKARWPRQALDAFCSPQFSLHRKKSGRRKLRLFLCACCRRIQHLIPEDPGHQALALGERLCEGEAVAEQIASLEERESHIQDSGVPLEVRHARHAAMASMGSSI